MYSTAININTLCGGRQSKGLAYLLSLRNLLIDNLRSSQILAGRTQDRKKQTSLYHPRTNVEVIGTLHSEYIHGSSGYDQP